MSKRVWLLPALAMVLIAVGGSAAFAVPSLGGPSGIVSVPNALVAPVGQASAAVSWQQMQGLDVYSESLTGDFSVWSLQVLGGVASGAELWAAYSNSADDLDTTTWGIGGKFQFLREPEAPVTLAVGASYQKETGDINLTQAIGMYGEEPEVVTLVDADIDDNVWKAYLAASKDFTPTGLTTEWAAGTRIVGTAGVLWMDIHRDVSISGVLADLLLGGPFSGDNSESMFRPFLGVEFMGTQGTTLGLEYRWKDSDFDAKNVFSAVLRQCFPNGFFGEVGTTNADPVGRGLDDQNFFVRAGYVFAFGGP